MLNRTKLTLAVAILSLAFAGSAVTYEVKASHDLETAQQAVGVGKKQVAAAKEIRVDERLVDQTVYNKRTQEFFKRATNNATSTESVLKARTAADERYGSPEAYEAIKALAGTATSMQVTSLKMTFNEQSDGSVVGAGDVKLSLSAASDDASAQVKHVTSEYTGLVSLEKYEGKWRVTEVKLGTINPGDNANDTIY